MILAESAFGSACEDSARSTHLHPEPSSEVCSGCRWAAVPDEDWPQDGAQRGVILAIFASSSTYRGINADKQRSFSLQDSAAKHPLITEVCA